MDLLSWHTGAGGLAEWLTGLLRRFDASPGKFQIQRGGEKVWHHDAPGNHSPYTQTISNTHVGTVPELAAELAGDHVPSVQFTASTPDHWCLRATPGDRSRADWVKVLMPRAQRWPLPARLRDGRDLRRLLAGLAGVLALAPPGPDPGSLERYRRPIELDGEVGSHHYRLRVTGWADEALHLRGETPLLLGKLSLLFGPRDETSRPLRSLGELVRVCQELEAEMGRLPVRAPLTLPGGDLVLPTDARLKVTRGGGTVPAFEVTTSELIAESDHPDLSLREGIALLMCRQLYTACAVAELPEWLRSLENGVFGRPGIWTVRGGNRRPPSHRGSAMVARALLDQGAAGRASVALATAEFITVQGVLLGGAPAELVGTSRRRARR
ncbi:hypothetical protein [Marinactinospora rubrisoli]|uniref:Uncharacterized protein n=1 Tax=Marinactinospora rubrisoli TaxID=2715399 RepID=A0ABW2KHI5_9ACTN